MKVSPLPLGVHSKGSSGFEVGAWALIKVPNCPGCCLDHTAPSGSPKMLQASHAPKSWNKGQHRQKSPPPPATNPANTWRTFKRQRADILSQRGRGAPFQVWQGLSIRSREGLGLKGRSLAGPCSRDTHPLSHLVHTTI